MPFSRDFRVGGVKLIDVLILVFVQARLLSHIVQMVTPVLGTLIDHGVFQILLRIMASRYKPARRG